MEFAEHYPTNDYYYINLSEYTALTNIWMLARDTSWLMRYVVPLMGSTILEREELINADIPLVNQFIAVERDIREEVNSVELKILSYFDDFIGNKGGDTKG